MTRAADILGAVMAAVTFLTQVRLPEAQAREADLGMAVAFFPLVGVMLGIVLAAVAWAVGARLPAPLTAVVMVALLSGLTGGLHLDGLADVFDGLGGARGDRERTLAIMRDSHIGAHGTVAVVLVVLAKVFAISVILQHADWRALVLFPAMARWTAVPLIVFFPYARPTGLGRSFKDQASTRDLVWATALAVVITVVLGVRFIGGALVALGVALALGAWMQRRLGGLTGDVYGAAIELAEVAFLAVACSGV